MLRITTLFALTIAAAQPALAAPIEHGQGDGERFDYTTELRANGVIHISGIVLGTHEQFALDVTPNGHVDGLFGDTPVEYNVGKQTRDKVAAQFDEGRALASAGLPN
jgi:hypothetical protein